jgi:hypothetical protein
MAKVMHNIWFYFNKEENRNIIKNMIDLSLAKLSSKKTQVTPSDNIFLELWNNTYDYLDLLSELIDNSLAQKKAGTVSVTVDLLANNSDAVKELIITDNAKWISRNDLWICISPAWKQSHNWLHEHGLWMKQAIAAMWKLKYLATKTDSEKNGSLIKKFGFWEIETYDINLPFDSGTIIAVEEIKSIISGNPTLITRWLVPQLWARYRKYLKQNNKILNLVIRIKDIETDEIRNSWTVEEVKPIYFHPSTRRNEPIIHKFEVSEGEWHAELTFWYAPSSKEEYEELDMEPVSKFHPYNVSLSKQWLDIILHDRVILFSQLSEIGIISWKHNDYNTIRWEIVLKNWFKTAITKNSIIRDANFIQCIEKISKILHWELSWPWGKTKNYINTKTYPDEIPEKLLRDRLSSWLKSNPVHPKKTVNMEYVVEGVEWFIDIYADWEAWELKTHPANALDVYQLFMYLDIAGLEKWFLLAKDFTPGAQVAVQKIKENHSKEIILSRLEAFPINHHPSQEERSNYY